MAITLEGTRSPIRKIDALLQLLKVYEVQSNVLEQEKILYELFEMDEVSGNDFLHNLLKLHLGTVLSTNPGDPRWLEILETMTPLLGITTASI